MNFTKDLYTHKVRAKIIVNIPIEVDCICILEGDDKDEAEESANNLRYKSKIVDASTILARPPRDFYSEAVARALDKRFDIEDFEVEQTPDETPIVYPLTKSEYRQHQELIPDDEAKAAYEFHAHDQAEFNKNGFFCHINTKDPKSPTGYNLHTHGFDKSWNHHDIQIVLPLSSVNDHVVAKNLIKKIVSLIKTGDKFAPGQISDRIVQGQNVTFIPVTEDNRIVLRMIMQDRSGIIDMSQMDPAFAVQYLEVK